MRALTGEFDALKQYVRQAAELNAAQQRELEARLDYLVAAAAAGTPRIDWWNQAVGALVGLVLQSIVPADVVQSLLVMAAHGLAALFGGGPPPLAPPVV